MQARCRMAKGFPMCSYIQIKITISGYTALHCYCLRAKQRHSFLAQTKQGNQTRYPWERRPAVQGIHTARASTGSNLINCPCSHTQGQVLLQGDGRIVYSQHPFWRQPACPSHERDGTPRCTGCSRLEPRGEEWPALEDGPNTKKRAVCLACLQSAVFNTQDAQPLYDEVRPIQDSWVSAHRALCIWLIV